MSAASWVLLLLGLCLAAALSFVLLSAETMFGMGQVVSAGPAFVIAVVYLITMPVIFGTIGLFRSTVKRRFIAGGAMLMSIAIYTAIAFTR